MSESRSEGDWRDKGVWNTNGVSWTNSKQQLAVGLGISRPFISTRDAKLEQTRIQIDGVCKLVQRNSVSELTERKYCKPDFIYLSLHLDLNNDMENSFKKIYSSL